jgi:hypothetical protein
MWFWLFLILAVASVVGTIFLWRWDDCSGWTLFGLILSGILVMVVFIMGFCAINAHVGLEAKTAKNQQIYNSLVYQLENDLYDNDNDLGKKELYNQIQEWNKDLAYYKHIQNDLWNGIFYPNIYDQFKYIELPNKGS